jgi:hypothetical protein
MTTDSDFLGRPAPKSPISASGDASRCHAFLIDLTEVCAKHGIGIAGDAQLFIMEPEDFPHSYSVDAKGRLYRV